MLLLHYTETSNFDFEKLALSHLNEPFLALEPTLTNALLAMWMRSHILTNRCYAWSIRCSESATSPTSPRPSDRDVEFEMAPHDIQCSPRYTAVVRCSKISMLETSARMRARGKDRWRFHAHTNWIQLLMRWTCWRSNSPDLAWESYCYACSSVEMNIHEPKRGSKSRMQTRSPDRDDGNYIILEIVQ